MLNQTEVFKLTELTVIQNGKLNWQFKNIEEQYHLFKPLGKLIS